MQLTITNKREAIAVVVSLVLLFVVIFVAGRYSVYQKSTEVKKVIQTETQTETHKDKHEVSHTVTTKLPDGTETTVTDVDSVVVSDHGRSTSSTTKMESVSNNENRKKTNVSAIVAVDFRNPTPVYGVSVSKELLGPFTIGIVGLTNATVGLSIGLNF